MPDFSLLVETADLRDALSAVAPFVEEKIDDLSRIRVHATTGITTVSATNGSAAALAAVSTWSLDNGAGSDDNAAVFDLSATDAKKILQVFKGKPGNDDEPGEEVRIDVDAEHTTITDASGFFEGQQLVLPRLPELEHAANVHRFLGQYLHERPGSPEIPVLPLYGPNLALFVRACKVYGTEAVIELHHREERDLVLVRCGDSFIGGLTVSRWDEEKAETNKVWRDAWNRRIKAPLEAVK